VQEISLKKLTNFQQAKFKKREGEKAEPSQNLKVWTLRLLQI